MAKNTLFRRELFGFSKADVNHYIMQQNTRLQTLSNDLAALEQRFESYRKLHETMTSAYQANLAVLRDVQERAAKSDSEVRRLATLFSSLADAYRDLYRYAQSQKEAVAVAQLYESKAVKYDALSEQMKELVLPASMRQENAEPLPTLPIVDDLPEMDAFNDYCRQADIALREMSEDAKELYEATGRLHVPTDAENAG